jgi:hypothetical protein
MAVIAPSIAEVVRFAGGWIVDQGLAGWEVFVLTADRGDPRPLRILGTHPHDLEAVLASPAALGQCLGAIVVTADLYRSDVRIRRMAGHARAVGSADVRLWGDLRRWDPEVVAPPVPHRLSRAARAFKSHALTAARIAGDADTDIEVFRGLSVQGETSDAD